MADSSPRIRSSGVGWNVRSIVGRQMKNCGRPDRRDERAETSEKEAQIRHSKSNSVIRLQSPVDCREDATSSVRVA
ncbi:hypothetical protein V9T40_008256 [Parthenolecanium corni]|uniref:Uncharacterized protein n=1 Tax=Parthenolecanium corni TaxID=536013 RepID=A0AAN9Y7W8_9HEMI